MRLFFQLPTPLLSTSFGNISVGEVNAEAKLQIAGIQRIIWHSKIVLAKPALIHMTPQHIKPHLIKFGGKISVAKSVVADSLPVLHVKTHRGRLIGISMVAGVVITIYSEVDIQNPESPETDNREKIIRKLRSGKSWRSQVRRLPSLNMWEPASIRLLFRRT